MEWGSLIICLQNQKTTIICHISYQASAGSLWKGTEKLLKLSQWFAGSYFHQMMFVNQVANIHVNTQKKKQPILNEFSKKSQRPNCKGGGGAVDMQ